MGFWGFGVLGFWDTIYNFNLRFIFLVQYFSIMLSYPVFHIG